MGERRANERSEPPDIGTLSLRDSHPGRPLPWPVVDMVPEPTASDAQWARFTHADLPSLSKSELSWELDRITHGLVTYRLRREAPSWLLDRAELLRRELRHRRARDRRPQVMAHVGGLMNP